MGVRGLTTFIQSNPRKYGNFCTWTKCAEQQETAPLILIDGSALVYYICYGTGVEAGIEIGGDYAMLQHLMAQFLKQLHGVGLQSRIVLDGMPPSAGAKSNVMKERREAQVNSARHIYNFVREHGFESGACPGAMKRQRESLHGRLVPLFAEMVLCEVCEELGIRWDYAAGEADQALAKLCQSHKAPDALGHGEVPAAVVLSNDSDFLIYSGVFWMPLWSLEVDNGRVGGWVLSSTELASSLHLSAVQMPPLACLLGNDVVRVEGEVVFSMQARKAPAPGTHCNDKKTITALAHFIRTHYHPPAVPEILQNESMPTEGMAAIQTLADSLEAAVLSKRRTQQSHKRRKRKKPAPKVGLASLLAPLLATGCSSYDTSNPDNVKLKRFPVHPALMAGATPHNELWCRPLIESSGTSAWHRVRELRAELYKLLTAPRAECGHCLQMTEHYMVGTHYKATILQVSNLTPSQLNPPALDELPKQLRSLGLVAWTMPAVGLGGGIASAFLHSAFPASHAVEAAWSSNHSHRVSGQEAADFVNDWALVQVLVWHVNAWVMIMKDQGDERFCNLSVICPQQMRPKLALRIVTSTAEGEHLVMEDWAAAAKQVMDVLPSVPPCFGQASSA
ncbi:unnamed protein product [Chrysoparadoxa australica]